MVSVLTAEILKGPPMYSPKPHVVLLGAGASKAAFPNGDKNGKSLPLMDDLPLILGKPWETLIEESNCPDGSFESQFSWLRSEEKYQKELRTIEESIFSYFEDLELPDTPTIYDYLILGLRSKDVVATFNWDPFLYQAYKRNSKCSSRPDIRFLHGCVTYATCENLDHDILGSPGEYCPHCENSLVQGKLFFPDYDKDYTKDSFVAHDWEKVTDSLKEAFHLTIFGYSGPKTDFNARSLILDGWNKTLFRDFSHVEFIDILEQDKIYANWKEFIPHHHIMHFHDFWDSTIARWPRRTQDYKVSASIEGIPSKYIGPFKTDSLHELQKWHLDISKNEK